MKQFTLFLAVIAYLLSYSPLSADESDADKLSLLLGASNAGTEFLMTFHPCWEDPGPNNGIRIYVSSLYKTKVTLNIPGLGINMVKETVPNDVIEFTLKPTEAQMYSKGSGALPNPPEPSQVWKERAIIITADDPIICYGVTRFQYTSDGYMALPKNVLGTDYQVASYADPTNNTAQFLPSYTSIVGAYDNTRVTFKLGGKVDGMIINDNGDTLKVGQSISKYIQKGDVWLIAGVGGFNDLTGSNINADKPVAVISGNYCAYIPTHMAACDYIIEQELPIYNWGKNYLIAPIFARKNFPVVKIFAAEANTKVNVDGELLATIQTPGGIEGVGFIESRAGFTATPRPVRISSDKPINVVLYNPGQQDDGVENDPFQMQILPIEQFQTDIVFNTPGIKGGYGFKDNFLNVVFLGNADGTIPDDIMFTDVIDGKLNWVPLKSLSPGAHIIYGEEKDGRSYYFKTVKLNYDGVFRMKADEPFAVYAYGYDTYDSYGFPASGRLIDVSSNDTVAPEIVYEMDANGNISGVVRDLIQTPGKVIKDGDIIQSAEKPAGLSAVQLVNALSNNYTMENPDFIPGIDNETNFQLKVIDKYKSAKAVLAVTDRRGNNNVVEFDYKAKLIPGFLADETYFGILKSGKEAVLEFSLTNNDEEITEPILSIVLEFDDPQFEIINNITPNTAFKPGDIHKFSVRFKARDMYDGDINEIENQFVNRIGMEITEGEIEYFNYIFADVKNPRISVSSVDFATQMIGETINDEFVTISNTEEVALLISGFEVSGSSEFVFDLPDASEEAPVLVEPNSQLQIKTKFIPSETGEYEATLKVLSDAYVEEATNVATISGKIIPTSVIDDKLFGGSFAVNYDGGAFSFRAEHDAVLSGLKVFDLSGRTIFSTNVSNSINQYNALVPGLTNGVYLLHLNINGVWMSKKVTI